MLRWMRRRRRRGRCSPDGQESGSSQGVEIDDGICVVSENPTRFFPTAFDHRDICSSKHPFHVALVALLVLVALVDLVDLVDLIALVALGRHDAFWSD
jgi:hypothetical protein